MKGLLFTAGVVSAVALASSANASVIWIDNVIAPTYSAESTEGTFQTKAATFVDGVPTYIRAAFSSGYQQAVAGSGSAPGGATFFSDEFKFVIGNNGTGSGSVSTSFSGDNNVLTITSLLINGNPYAVTPGGGQSTSVNGIVINFGEINTITVSGYYYGEGGYNGGATFTAAVPETATWAMMVVGFGAIGTMARASRRNTKVSFG